MARVLLTMLYGLAMVLSSGCAAGTGQHVMHAVTYENKGKSDVYDFMIEYGDFKLPSPRGDDNFARGGGRTFAAKMPVAEKAIVRWREASGVQHVETVKVSRYAPAGRMRMATVVIIIRDSGLEAYLEVSKGIPQNINDIEYERVPLYSP